MKLYYAPGTCALADHIALEWIGKPYTAQRLSREEMKSAEYLRLNPAGAVPTLEHEGWVLTQNVAILNYLADSFPEAKLGGDGTPKSRAEVNRWLAYINADVHPAFRPLFGYSDFLDDPTAIEKAKQHARKTLRSHFERINTQLEGRGWLTGSRSMADPYLFVILRWARAQKLDLNGLDNLEGYFQRMRDDKGVAAVLKEQGLD